MEVGDVVLCEYVNFDGELTKGLFVISYVEKSDVIQSDNFTAIKISSESYCYQVLLEKKFMPFLEHDSYLNCNQMFRFREKSIVGTVGKLTNYYKNKMIQQITNYYKKMIGEITISIGKENLFNDQEEII